MDGVTILSTTEPSAVGFLVCLFMTIGCFACFVYSIYDGIVNEMYQLFIVTAVTLVFTVIFAYATYITTTTEYKVTIDETVNYTEFTAMYEVIDQEGAIYTVRLKNEINKED